MSNSFILVVGDKDDEDNDNKNYFFNEFLFWATYCIKV